jgi:cytochrome c oxidase cbb3-type subunit 3/ubiquinol-cytochrome c reductase cytochrome c subunit
LVALLAAGVGSCARGGAGTGDAGASADAGLPANLSAASGATLFKNMCAVCHGASGEGYKADNAPSLTNPTFLSSATDEQISHGIAHGRPGTSMAPYGKAQGGPLDVPEVQRLVAWIRSHGAGPEALATPAPGNAALGLPLFQQHCQQCHGTASGRGTAVHLHNPRFLEASSDAFIRYAIDRGRPGTPMAAWRGRLSEGQIDDLVSYIRTLGKPVTVVPLPPPTGKEPIVINPAGAAPSFVPRADPCYPEGKCVKDPRYVSVDQLKQALQDKRRVVVIDARSPGDWMRVHIPGALSIPHYDLGRLKEIPNDGTWIIAYCACPHHLSGDVVAELRKRGYKHAMILDEGILEWHRRGYPVVAATGVEAPPLEPSRAPVHALPSALPLPR